ncbi:signal transduction histidine kinase CheA [Vibrio orientalis CIP 102891 = ATCC 33934]|uniref:Chemotaxis protein CheA n=1 Tax=Vibrio orientalis CIP 102891 = ATCC 33934 TaxID=675816 RepID=C9QGB5_VIBOR|nr:chemotaxis protein CheA [Vibrio orientalis]EEX94797.1 chemotaxis protein CheA [Vibrio orientalis CIP 102891 = ATCC 33934]EGU53074.1 signal transduction histidine kinase CheA [Vibrio orientalis CIP 102891 = ATCC 33934]
MALDMEQLRKMFYEECRENLEVLEEVLLNLDLAHIEDESINTIFRAAHSIKGGAGTFNLLDISEFTHNVEAYLDLVRNQERTLTADSIDLLLKSGDCIHSMLEGHEQGTDVNLDLKQEVSQKLAELLGSDSSEPEVVDCESEDVLETSSNADQVWNISFAPHQDMFFSGNDPLRILRELSELDDSCQINIDTSALPELQEIESELCFLSWHATISGALDLDLIKEIFEWVEDECDLTIELSQPDIEQPAEDSQQTTSPVTTVENTETKPVPESAAKSTKVAKSDSSVSSIRVDIDKVDSLINLVGELVITQSMLTEIGNDFSIDKLEKLKSGLDQLLQNSKDLQENVLNIRMLPMSFAFSRFPRLVRDLSSRLEKQVDLQIKGEQTELDKTVLERIVDPLVHLVRNGIDHGIEQPEQRLENGKSEMGVIELNAYHQGGAIVIEIRDDGAGLNCDKLWNKALEKGVLSPDSRREEYSDKQIMNLIFAPGFSTAEEVSDISGRGVGMDVVRRNIEELGGHIEVESELGKGSRFTISLPLTLAILDGQLVRVAGEVYVIPLLTIVESIQIDPQCIKLASGGIELYRLREENIPILRLQEELEMGSSGGLDQRILCFVEAAGNRVGLLLDELLDQQQVVIKSLESNYSKVAGISGATILGDGSVSLIIDVQGLITNFLNRTSDSSNKGLAA